MLRRKGKLLSWILLLVLLAACFPVQAEVVGSKSNQQPASTGKISLEQAIQTVKGNFTVPGKLKTFASSYDNFQDRQCWRLNWSSPDIEGAGFSADVDAVSGEIISMNKWTQTDNAFSKTPSLSVMEASRIGQELLKRLVPGKVGNLVLQKDADLIPLGDYNSPRYTMTWKRTYHGINVAMDSVRMEIDMQTGEVMNYNLNWTDQVLPDPTAAISKEQANQLFVSQDVLKLQYFIGPTYKPAAQNQLITPKLIYGIRHPSNGMIDALNGKLLSVGGYNMYDSMGMREVMKLPLNQSNIEAPIALTPEEQKEVEGAATYLSQEKAVEVVKKWLPMTDKMKLESASLDRDWQHPETRIWRFNWNQNTVGTDQYASVFAQVDAVNGELLTFNLNIPPEKAVGKDEIIDQKAAQSLAERFIKEIQPQRWDEIKLQEPAAPTRPMDMNPPTWSFSYQRAVNGVLCPDNGIEIAIDAGSKMVTTYRLNWSKTSFPPAHDVLDRNRANEIFLKAAPLTLTYAFVPDTDGKEKIKLVYMPELKDGFNMIDAVTGKGLDAEGKAIENKLKAYVFQDIKGNFGEKEISLLGQAGIMGEYNDVFHPDENIKLRSLLRAMLSAKEGIYSTRELDDKEILKHCQNLGWIAENSQLDANVSREQLAGLMIRLLNIDYLSQIQGIYQVPYTDKDKMSAQTKAYAALCYGLGIIRADGKTFNGSHSISRAEAAVALVHTLSQKNRP